METELKYRFPHKDGPARFLEDRWIHEMALPEGLQEYEMDARYFDTEEGTLQSLGAAFRIREEGEAIVATLKTRSKVVGSLHQRMEWSLEQEDDQPDPERFRRMAHSQGDPDEVLEEIMEALGDRELKEIARTRFDRSVLLIGMEDTLVEVAVDVGTLTGGRHTEAFAELELELKEGDARVLLALGEAMAERYGLIPETRSKYRRCLDLAKKEEEN